MAAKQSHCTEGDRFARNDTAAMYNPDTDLLFPGRVIPSLRDQRSETWQGLVKRVCAAEPESIEYLAFILMMARLDGCASCNADSFRAMQGCTACARQTLKRYRGSDEELLQQYRAARSDVEAYLRKEHSANQPTKDKRG